VAMSCPARLSVPQATLSIARSIPENADTLARAARQKFTRLKHRFAFCAAVFLRFDLLIREASCSKSC
jgi:hypothetical protein